MRKFINLSIAILIVFIGVFSVFQPEVQTAEAANAKNFNAGNIISDAVFTNNSAMTAAQIQDFLNKQNSVCLKSKTWLGLYDVNKNGLVEDKTKDEQYGGSTGKKTMTSAQLIKAAADIYRINPQVILVMLQKETSMLTTTDCAAWRYQSALGAGIPDSGSKDPDATKSFVSQIDYGTSYLRTYLTAMGKIGTKGYTYPYSHRVGSNKIKYHPTSSCGTKTVNIANQATAALYIYTPYTPDQKALDAGYGTGGSCSSYGNRNFYLFFVDYFGSASYTVGSKFTSKYNSAGGASALGLPTSNQACGLKDGGCFQMFEKVGMYWSSKTGAWTNKGAIRARFSALKWENGFLGYPASDEACGLKDGGCYQRFQDGKIYWTSKTGAWDVHGGIRGRWDKLKWENGILGYPTSGEIKSASGVYQKFQKGVMIWSSKTGAWEQPAGAIRDRYGKLNYEHGKLGYPNGAYTCKDSTHCYQSYQNGVIIWSKKTGAWEMFKGQIRNKYASLGYEHGKLGYPTAAEAKTASGTSIYQQFENGRIYYSAARGAWVEYK
ncbi:MAG: hypothetical protein LBL08_00140 [Candidatus Nomurabacteria bacterium]|jgi:hypothetical protein|nr:hypothetical protein [Candidatus Nomurabacteria bacterium]